MYRHHQESWRIRLARSLLHRGTPRICILSCASYGRQKCCNTMARLPATEGWRVLPIKVTNPDAQSSDPLSPSPGPIFPSLEPKSSKELPPHVPTLSPGLPSTDFQGGILWKHDIPDPSPCHNKSKGNYTLAITMIDSSRHQKKDVILKESGTEVQPKSGGVTMIAARIPLVEAR